MIRKENEEGDEKETWSVKKKSDRDAEGEKLKKGEKEEQRRIKRLSRLEQRSLSLSLSSFAFFLPPNTS